MKVLLNFAAWMVARRMKKQIKKQIGKDSVPSTMLGGITLQIGDFTI